MTIKRLKNGRYQYRWRDTKRKQRAKNFRTKEQAQYFVRQLDRGKEIPADSHMSFRDFADKWHRDYCKVEKAESQWVSDWNLIRTYLLPTFGPHRIGELTKVSLLDFRAKLKTEGRLSVKTINLATGLARKMLATAVEWDLLMANPWAAVKLLRQPEQAFAYWQVKERDQFLAHCRSIDPAFADLVEFACHTGMRQGEIRALRGDCVDFARGKIVVRRGWARDLAVPEREKLLEYTKGKKIREVEMNDAVRRLVTRARFTGPGAYVFAFEPQHASRKLRRIAKEARVPAIRFHDLRHTFASHLAMAGIPMHKLQALLGHTELRQTMRYAHLAPESFEGITAVLVSAQNVHAHGKENLTSEHLRWKGVGAHGFEPYLTGNMK